MKLNEEAKWNSTELHRINTSRHCTHKETTFPHPHADRRGNSLIMTTCVEGRGYAVL